MKTFCILILTSIILCNSNLGQSVSGNIEKTNDQVSASLNNLLDEFYNDNLRLDPITATSLGDNRFNDTLPNYFSQAYIKESRILFTSYLSKLVAFDRNALSGSDRLNFDLLKWLIEINLEGLQYRSELIPLSQLSLQVYFPIIAANGFQPLKDAEDYNKWLRRVEDFVVICDTAIMNMRKGAMTGYTLPKSLASRMIEQTDSFLNGLIEENIFYTPLKILPENISPEDKQFIRKEYISMIENKIIPLYTRLRDFLKNEYMPLCRKTSGINDIPEGGKYYAYLIRLYTSTELTPDEVYKIGLEEVDRISAEILKIRDKIGFKGDLVSFLNYVRTNKDIIPFTKPEEVMGHFEQIRKVVDVNMPNLFANVPTTRLEIRRTESFREKTSSAEFMPGLPDGSRPAIFYVPIPDVNNYSILQDESTFLHEGSPGHYFQISLQLENENLPKFRRLLPAVAYMEGWALYAESLGKELGLYSDTYQYLGMLSNDMHRAIRLVVDAGIHAKGWTREEAIDYSLKHEPESEQSIISEVERYMAIPGQALSYKIGQLKLIELRKKAIYKLGNKFDLKQFHSIILESGGIPLSMVEERVNNWIDSMIKP